MSSSLVGSSSPFYAVYDKIPKILLRNVEPIRSAAKHEHSAVAAATAAVAKYARSISAATRHATTTGNAATRHANEHAAASPAKPGSPSAAVSATPTSDAATNATAANSAATDATATRLVESANAVFADSCVLGPNRSAHSFGWYVFQLQISNFRFEIALAKLLVILLVFI